MSVFNEEAFEEGLVSELELFDLPSTQTSVNEVYYEEIRPLSAVSSEGPFEFRINGQNSTDYLDLKNSQLYVKFKLQKADGTKVGAVTVDKVGPANLILQSLFSASDVTLQSKATFTNTYNPYRGFIHTLLNYGEDAHLSQIVTQGWYKDDSDSPGETDPGGSNNGLNKRAKWTENSKIMDLQGPIFHDLFSMERYLLNQVDVKLKLYRSPASFALLAADDQTNYKINIEDIYVLARKIRVNPAVLYGQSKQLEKRNALYPYRKVEVRSQSVATGSTSFQWDNLFQGRKPEKVVLAFVKSKALNGDYTTNPYNFEHCGINHIALYADGLPVGGNPLKLDFTTSDGTAIMRAYTDLLKSAGKWRQDEGNGVDLTHYISGSTLFAFQLEPDFSQHGEFLSLVKHGNVRLEVQFTTGLTGEQLAVFRDEKGVAHVLNAYCPHMGANLAVGGRVIGDCIECPFHGWKFRGHDGKCTHIPYAEKIPDIARVKSWNTLEVNGWVYMWYHAEGIEPTWTPPELPDITSGTWQYSGRSEHFINAHIEEIPENGADVAHLDQVHSPAILAGIDLTTMWNRLFSFALHKWTAAWSQNAAPEGHIGTLNLTHNMCLFGYSVSPLFLEVQARQIGPGIVYLTFESFFGKGVYIQSLTPVEPMVQKLVHNLYMHWTIPQAIANFFLLGEVIQVERDVMIWNNKKYEAKPLFVKSAEDSLIARHRRWYSQFYSEHSPRLKFQKETLEW